MTAAAKTPLDLAVETWCGTVGDLTDVEYIARLFAAIHETSSVLAACMTDEFGRSEVLEHQAQLVGEWLRMMEPRR